MDEVDFVFDDRIDIVFYIFRIRCNDRTVVVVVGIFKFIPFIWNRRIENVFDSVVDQPLNMSVSQFCRITFGFTWNGFDTEFVNFSRRSRREYDTESEFGEKCKPEWIIFVHVKYTGNSDYSSRGIFFGKRFIIKIPMKFIVKQVWQRICIFFFSETSFTSVSGYKFSAAAEVIDRKTTSVCTSAAFCHSS